MRTESTLRADRDPVHAGGDGERSRDTRPDWGGGISGADAVITREQGVHGTATAASIFGTGAIGAAVAFGYWDVSILLHREPGHAGAFGDAEEESAFLRSGRGFRTGLAS